MESDSTTTASGVSLETGQRPSAHRVETGSKIKLSTGRNREYTLADNCESDVMVIPSDPLTPDQVLSVLGSGNVYLLFIWISMGLVWGLSAMPMMVSAFIMGELCLPSTSSPAVEEINNTTNSLNCAPLESTIAQEFNLTGTKAPFLEYTTSAFLFGVVVGSAFLPILSDKKGRRLVLLLSMANMGIIGCASALAPDILSFTILRFLQGVFFTGCGVTNWILAYESIPIQLRSYTALVFGLFWVVGYCLVAPLAYWLPHWRHLLVATSLPLLVFSVVYYFIVPESFHFLVSKGGRPAKEVGEWVKRANRYARWRGTPTATLHVEEFCENARQAAIAEGVLLKEEEEENSSPNKGLLQQLLSSRVLLLYTLVMIYLWTCDTFVYYGLSLFSTQLAGDRFLNFALMGLIEIPSYLLSPPLLNRLGRRAFVSLCHLLAALSFFAVILVGESPGLMRLMWLMGKFAISSAFTSLFVYSSEVFPTVARNGCIGVCSVVARLGGAFAPTVRSMALVSPILPTLFFGVSAGVGAALTLLLPETLNKELPDSPDQMVGALPRKAKSGRSST